PGRNFWRNIRATRGTTYATYRLVFLAPVRGEPSALRHLIIRSLRDLFSPWREITQRLQHPLAAAFLHHSNDNGERREHEQQHRLGGGANQEIDNHHAGE